MVKATSVFLTIMAAAFGTMCKCILNEQISKIVLVLNGFNHCFFGEVSSESLISSFDFHLRFHFLHVHEIFLLVTAHVTSNLKLLNQIYYCSLRKTIILPAAKSSYVHDLILLVSLKPCYFQFFTVVLF